MYWPVGVPRVYAAATNGGITLSDDNEGTTATGDGLNAAKIEIENIDEAPTDDDGGNVDETNTKECMSNGSGNRTVTPSPRPKSISSRRSSSYAAAVKDNGDVIGLRVSRTGHMFATITNATLTIWQTRPTAILASVIRSKHSLDTYGPNVSLLLRPDSAIFVVQTSFGYLITYSLATDPNARVYRTQYANGINGHTRRQSVGRAYGRGTNERLPGAGEGGGVHEVSLRFRMVIKVDAGIGQALALDEELVVATWKPAAVQCIRWTPDSTGNQTSTELLSRMAWINKKAGVVNMVHDRPMNLSTWVLDDGKAYAVQRLSVARQDPSAPKKLFRGFCFHTPEKEDEFAIKAAINARFSLIAIGSTNGTIYVYSAKDYSGNIILSHKLSLSVSLSSSGRITFLNYSPDGYCLFAGFEKGWMTWSVYGKPGGSSFASDASITRQNDEGWLGGVRDGAWLGGGTEILLIGLNDDRLWVLEMARSAVAGCFSSANIARTMLVSNESLMVYRGYNLPDLTTISAEASLWHHVQIPASYLVNQWPSKCAVISPDGRYVAVAGRRGLAHYSVNSGRWKTFADSSMEDEFVVRGGMCWYQHILIAAVEAGDRFEVRLYSRELALDNEFILHVESLSAPAVLITPSGDDSLLVYTHENVVYHYIVTATADTVKLVLMGQIGFHGIVRATSRVRALSWILPDDQLYNGDPSQDVAVATVLFLVDGKLVMLQPSTTENGDSKYDMKVIAQNVEYYALMRDQPSFNLPPPENSLPPSPSTNGASDDVNRDHELRDSLWIFDGNGMRIWTDVRDVLSPAAVEHKRELLPSISIPVDFYPLSILLDKGIFLGVEPELLQRRDVNFALFRFAIRTHLFLPHIFRHHLAQHNSSAALHLAHHYHNLLYFPHALEILLHTVLDEEVDTQPSRSTALLPHVLSFLATFPQYLDILVQCTRKTEVRSWRTLFAYLPPPQELFEEAMQKGALKTAGGYMLVLHTFEELVESGEKLVRLLGRARQEGEWELCKELARFLVALDESGDMLREALRKVDLLDPRSEAEREGGSPADGYGNEKRVGLGISASSDDDGVSPRSAPRRNEQGGDGEDYFSVR
ncbi:MAG: hypothetical protein M1836_005605 [Candelina mexicana]|nr:MAG: hypothetical protein M1836_005605 [Candelina mexicana]